MGLRLHQNFWVSCQTDVRPSPRQAELYEPPPSAISFAGEGSCRQQQCVISQDSGALAAEKCVWLDLQVEGSWMVFISLTNMCSIQRTCCDSAVFPPLPKCGQAEMQSDVCLSMQQFVFPLDLDNLRWASVSEEFIQFSIQSLINSFDFFVLYIYMKSVSWKLTYVSAVVFILLEGYASGGLDGILNWSYGFAMPSYFPVLLSQYPVNCD